MQKISQIKKLSENSRQIFPKLWNAICWEWQHSDSGMPFLLVLLARVTTLIGYKVWWQYRSKNTYWTITIANSILNSEKRILVTWRFIPFQLKPYPTIRWVAKNACSLALLNKIDTSLFQSAILTQSLNSSSIYAIFSLFTSISFFLSLQRRLFHNTSNCFSSLLTPLMNLLKEERKEVSPSIHHNKNVKTH